MELLLLIMVGEEPPLPVLFLLDEVDEVPPSPALFLLDRMTVALSSELLLFVEVAEVPLLDLSCSSWWPRCRRR